MSGEPYCVWCNRIGHPSNDDCAAEYRARKAQQKLTPDERLHK